LRALRAEGFCRSKRRPGVFCQDSTILRAMASGNKKAACGRQTSLRGEKPSARSARKGAGQRATPAP